MAAEREVEQGGVLTHGKVWPYFIFITLALFTSFLGLGVLRLYNFRLEYKLNSINAQIEQLQCQRISLEQNMSALISPERIYGYSKKQLGMTFASEVKVLRLEEPLLAESRTPEKSLEIPKEREQEGWFYFFLEKAMAGE